MPDTLTTVESMAGKRVGAQMGALQATILEEQFADSEPQLMDNISLMVMDLLQGSVDGVLLTDLVAKTYIARYPGQLVISQVPVEYDNTAGVAVAVNKGDNASLLEVINSVIERVTTDGTFDAWVDEATALTLRCWRSKQHRRAGGKGNSPFPFVGAYKGKESL